MMATSYADLTLADIRKELKKRGAKTTGRKAECIDRLEHYDRNKNFQLLEDDREQPDFKLNLPAMQLYKDVNTAAEEGFTEDLSPQRIEFVPVFLNFLRDQSSGLYQAGLSNSFTPSKCPSSIRAIKYVSPGKDPVHRARTRKNYASSKAKTLRFPDTPGKSNVNLKQNVTKAPDVEQLLRESDSSLTAMPKSPAASRFSPKNLYSSTPKGSSDKTLSRHGSASPMFSPDCTSQDRHTRDKRHMGNLESDNHGIRNEKKHSEQKFSLGDFLSADNRKGYKKKSPLPRESSSHSVRQLPKKLDISDENAFPSIGSVPSQDKNPKRRINPTRITPLSSSQSNKSNPFNQSAKHSFGFPQGQSPSSPFLASEEGSRTLEEERELLRQERLKRQEVTSKDTILGGSGSDSPTSFVQQKTLGKSCEYLEASIDQVISRDILDILTQVYAELILCNMTPNIMVELYYIVQLLTVKIPMVTSDVEESKTNEGYMNTIHNCVYFATKVLTLIVDLIKLLDRTTVKLLTENPRVQLFTKTFQKQLVTYLESSSPVPVLNHQPKSPIGGVSFQSDTDNRNNFSCDQAFHTFRKQRDMFYEIIRMWEENHLTPGWSYNQALGSRIRHLLSMRIDPTNFAHFARLFKLQLLTMCRGEDVQFDLNQDPEDLGFLIALKKQHPEKYKRLHERLVTPSKLGGPCPAPSFPGSQDFFKEFIIIAANGTFNQYLKDVLIFNILQLNEQDFIVAESDERDPSESMVHTEARSVILNLRLLAKFLGFIEFLPYQTSHQLPECVVATHVDLRSKVCPPINLNLALRQCASYGCLIVGVTWVIEYLSMVDPVALHSKHYLTVLMTLVAFFKCIYVLRLDDSSLCTQCSRKYHSKTLAPSNSLLLKFLLGWLFDLPAFPAGLFFADVAEADIDQLEYELNLKVFKENYRYLCISCLRRLMCSESEVSSESRVLEMKTPSKKQIAKDKSMPQTPMKLDNSDFNLSPLKTPSKYVASPLKTPSKYVVSPMKTPSKYMAVGMIETPETTPLKVVDSQDETKINICLDISPFVDQQLITICCPFVGELKNLLSDFLLGVSASKNTGTNSCRRITPLSASDKQSPAQSEKQLQLQLEENFFHNHSSSVRKTTEFVIERLSSNIIKKIRTTSIPQHRETALEKLKTVIESEVQNSSVASDCKKEVIQNRVTELSQEMCGQLKSMSTQLLVQNYEEEARSNLLFLLPPDTTSEAVDVCCKLVLRSSSEKVISWTQSHLTPNLFSKELSQESDRLFRQAQKTADNQTMNSFASHDDTTLSTLEISEASVPSGETSFQGYQSSHNVSDILSSPTNQAATLRISKKSNFLESLPVMAKEHDPDVIAPSQLLKLLKTMIHKLVTSGSDLKEDEVAQDIQDLMDNVSLVIMKREDVTLMVFRALEALTVDLAMSVVSCVPSAMTPKIQQAFATLWKPVEDGGLIPSPCGLLSFMCSRTVMLICQNVSLKHQVAAWKKVEEFIILLLSSDLLSPASLQEQCIALLRHSWPEEVLSGLSSCIKGISKNSGNPKHSDDPSFTELLEWVGWVCGEMEEFPDLL